MSGILRLPKIAVPGQPLALSTTCFLGTGVHIFSFHICASIVGQPQLSTHLPSGTNQTLSVVDSGTGSEDMKKYENCLPRLGDTVLGRVTRINHTEATMGVFVVGETVCVDEFKGIIRQQDVRAYEKDKVKIISSFRPGDIVRAKVISLGDQSSYYLSTASNNLGVIFAHSDVGDPLHPINWHEMLSERTGIVEERKVAKPT